MHWHANDRPFRVATTDLSLEENARRVQAHTLEELRPVTEKIEDLMRVHGYPRKDLFAVMLALREAATNAFQHGNHGDPAKHVRVSYLVTPTEVLIEVEDQGRGFDPNLVPHPLSMANPARASGRGLFLMRVYMSWVSFNRAGNRMLLCRRRSPP